MLCFSLLLLFIASISAKENRIVGGEDAKPHEFPYQVSLQMLYHPENGTYVHFCGGTILNPNFVLTAAHCMIDKSAEFRAEMRIIAGAHVLNTTNGHEQIRKLSKFVAHKQFRGGVNPFDIAILKVSKPFKFNDQVKAGTLPPSDFNATGKAIMSGWGYMSNDYSYIPAETLQKGLVEIYNDTTCHEMWKGGKYHDTNICAGDIKGVPAACKGDSGGPFSQKQPKIDETYVIGVISWAHYPCGRMLKPTVMVETSHFVTWIRDNIKAMK
ncbi:trypsin-1-like [Culicoides brevitarsis]|uniref:trypsin-1-like n=1 Tax=Culicoides brevitarsis TaxID=469753 RepID=UPI00307C847A